MGQDVVIADMSASGIRAPAPEARHEERHTDGLGTHAVKFRHMFHTGSWGCGN